MKLILIHADQNVRNHLKQLLNDLDHIVVAESDHPRRLLGDIARHQPHAIFVGELASVFKDGTFPPLQDNVALVPVVRLPSDATDESLVSFLTEALETVRIEHQSQPARSYSTDEQRLVLMDDRYRKYAQDEKLGTELAGDPDREKDIFTQSEIYSMKTTYFYILFLIVALPALAQDTLLEKASDGSTLITKQNAWAVLRGRIGTYDNSYLTAERVATLMWGDQLNGIVDQFEHHAALEKKVKLLDDASAAAKSIDAVTFVFDPALGKYDFDSQSFPIIQAFGSDGTRMCPGSTYVCFDQKLIPNIAVPEAQAQALAKAVHDNGGSIEITVKATIKECRPTTPKEQGRVIGWQAKSAEEEPCDATMYKVILSVRSVEYRLKNPGTVLLTKNFDQGSPPVTATETAPPPSP